jgi:rSAM/selenodomain-associated transferase 1
MPATALVVFSRSPVPGQTKLRLQQPLSPFECALFHRACLADLNLLAGGIEMPSFLYYTGSLEGFHEDAGQAGGRPVPAGYETLQPPGYETQQPGYKTPQPLRLDNLEFRPQGTGDLGERMLRAASEVLQEYDQVLLIGSDLPDLTVAMLEEAVARLADNDLVVGPSDDGGYYLLGLKDLVPGLFSAIDWGTERVLRQTLQAADRERLMVALLQPMRDVDTWPDLIGYAGRAGASISGCLARQMVRRHLREERYDSHTGSP